MPNPARLGLIGLGRWGRVYAKTLGELSDRCRLTHVATSDPAKLAHMPAVTPVADWHALLGGVCDAVIIASPPMTHPAIVEACVAAGIPCMVEKPLSMDVAAATHVHELVSRSHVPVLVNHIHLFDPAYEALKRELARAGERIRLMVSEGGAWGPFREHTPALWDWAPHDVSVCLDLAGVRPERITALAGPADPAGIPEQISLMLEFPRGLGAWVHAGRVMPQKRRTLVVATDTHRYILDQLSQERLMVDEIHFDERYRTPEATQAAKRPIAIDSTAMPLARAIRYFLDGVAGGDRTRFGTALGLDVVNVLARAEQAMTPPRP